MDLTLLAALATTLAPQGDTRPIQGDSAYVSHDDSNKPVTPAVRAAAQTAQTSTRSASSEEVSQPNGPALTTPAHKPSLGEGVTPVVGTPRLTALLTAPMAQIEGSEAIVRGKNYKAILSEEGLRFSPVVGNRPNADVTLSLSAIERGGEPLAITSGSADIKDGALQMERGAAVEAYAYSLEGVEQTFTFHELSGAGDLTVRIDVETELAAELRDSGIVFSNSIAEVHYSEAFVLDASGIKTAIETSFDGSFIELTVPASYLAGATLPITIDPVINTFSFGGGVPDDSKPDLAFNSPSNQYFVVFEDFVSATDADTYGFTLSESGVVDAASFLSLSLGSTDLRRPRVALNLNTETFMVVAAGLPSGDTNRQIFGQMVAIDPGSATGLTTSSPFAVNDNPGSFDCLSPDVAGNTFPSNTESFAVVWNRVFSATDRDIHARIVNVDESFVTGRINVDNSVQDDRECRISNSIGDTSVADYYNTVWIRGDGSGTDTTGDVYNRRLYFNGTFDGPFPSTATQLTTTGDAFAPVTTSTLSRTLPLFDDLFHVVAYQRQFGSQASVYAIPVLFTDFAGTPQGVSLMEDFDFNLDQRDVDITTDGQGWMMVYSESFNGSATDYDTYYCAGHVQDAPGSGFRITMAERHENMAFSASGERFPAIASQFDGGEYGTPTTDDACAVWEDVSATTSTIEGATLDLENNTPTFGNISLGTQFCQANQNASGTKGWIRGVGLDQSVTTIKTIQASDVTTNAFGYLLVANTSGFVTNPAGAAGNLCVIGAGRYVDQISNSGATATLSTTVTPSGIPQPTGFVAIAPGETWFFQYWTRDVDGGGAPTSNFTNGLSMTFTN